jgi:hypothetical protein
VTGETVTSAGNPGPDTGAARGSDLVRADAARDLLTACIVRTVPAGAADWLGQSLREVSTGNDEKTLVRALGLAPRWLGRADLAVTQADRAAADSLRSGWDLDGLSVDQAARIALVLAWYRGDDAAFAQTVESLCRTAEINELVAYYRGLAIFPAAPLLQGRAREGVRSAITPVFEAVAHRNPFARTMFDQDAWNQMVLKALFIGSRLDPIQGLDVRANADLAVMLVDYAHERWAASRPISPELWRCVGPFADARAFEAPSRALDSGEPRERLAAALALQACPDARARDSLARYPDCVRQLEQGGVTWQTLGQTASA